MKKLFLGLLALGMFQLSHAQTKEKTNVDYENDTKIAPPPPPPPPPPAVKPPPPPPPAPPKAPRPPKPPKEKKVTFVAPVIVKDEEVK